MHPLEGERILAAWERSSTEREPWRALALLQASMPEAGRDGLATLPLAERNALLLRLHEVSFGRWLQAFATCPGCGVQLEFAIDAQELRAQLAPAVSESWSEDGLAYSMRPVNTADLAALCDVKDLDAARTVLLSRAIDVFHDDARTATSLEQPHWIERFERINASAETRIALACASCGDCPTLDLDLAGFLWREVSVAARRLLAEVHALARAYGWSESAILTMSPTRRALYLEMLDA